jgi:hypothetical protein
VRVCEGFLYTAGTMKRTLLMSRAVVTSTGFRTFQ